jgi:hypothetical protein
MCSSGYVSCGICAALDRPARGFPYRRRSFSFCVAFSFEQIVSELEVVVLIVSK